jgi:hypothetical protein
MTNSRDKILTAVLDFSWGNYGFDELAELASDDPEIGIFGDLADHIDGYLRVT